MATYASNTSGAAKARAWLGADYAGESVRLKEAKATKRDQYRVALDAAIAEQKRIDAEEEAARSDENDSFGEYFAEFVQVVVAIGATIATGGNLAIGFATYQGLQELEEGWYDYAESEALNDIDTSLLTELQGQMEGFDFDMGRLDKKYASLNAALWESGQEDYQRATLAESEGLLTAFETAREKKDSGKWYNFLGESLVDAGVSAAKSYIAAYALQTGSSAIAGGSEVATDIPANYPIDW